MFKRMSSIPIQSGFKQKWRHPNPSKYWNVAGFNPKPGTYSSLGIFIHWACQWQESIFLALPLKSLSGKCTKLHTVAASNNRDHPTRSLYYCLFAPHWVLLFVHISFVVNRTFNVMPTITLKHLQQWWARIVEMTESEGDK